MFVVIAYRYGCIEAHNYLVCASSESGAVELSNAYKRAEEEHDHRGGKYGVTVYFILDEKENNGFKREVLSNGNHSISVSLVPCTKENSQLRRKIVAHFPSTVGEEEPYNGDV